MGGSTKKVPFPPWLTKKKGGIEERYIRLGNSFLLDPVVLSLSRAALQILIHMHLESGGQRDFEFPYNKYKKLISKQGFQSVLAELTEKGFIDIKENNARLCKPNVYSFSCHWREEKP